METPHVKNQHLRRIESACLASDGYVDGVGFTLPITLQIAIRALAASPANPSAVAVNGHPYGAPAMLEGAVHRYDFFAKGQVVTVADGYELLVPIGMGRYYTMRKPAPGDNVIMDTNYDPLKDTVDDPLRSA